MEHTLTFCVGVIRPVAAAQVGYRRARDVSAHPSVPLLCAVANGEVEGATAAATLNSTKDSSRNRPLALIYCCRIPYDLAGR